MNQESDKASQLKKYFFVLVENFLTNRHGKDKSARIFNEFKHIFNELLSKNEDLMADSLSKESGLNPIFIIALHRAYKKNDITLDNFRDEILSIYETMLAEYINQIKIKITQCDDPFSEFGKIIISGTKKLYDNEYFKAEIIQANDDGYHLDINRCLYFEIFQANDAVELPPILCDYDLIITKAVEKWVKFERPEKIVDGDSRCVFLYHPRK